jgi:ribosomal protein L21E
MLCQNYVNVESVIKVNVGGTIFETTAKTLGKEVRNSRNHLLQRLLEKYKIKKGPFIFIDRDPTYFRYILNFSYEIFFKFIGGRVVLRIMASKSGKRTLVICL